MSYTSNSRKRHKTESSVSCPAVVLCCKRLSPSEEMTNDWGMQAALQADNVLDAKLAEGFTPEGESSLEDVSSEEESEEEEEIASSTEGPHILFVTEQVRKRSICIDVKPSHLLSNMETPSLQAERNVCTQVAHVNAMEHLLSDVAVSSNCRNFSSLGFAQHFQCKDEQTCHQCILHAGVRQIDSSQLLQTVLWT